jgi:anion-transporting  ArsA/GET3 family ATPase
MTPRLHVLLGAGGVGKTTLAAAYALALADSGRRVGLLGIDPSRRLEGALGLVLADLEAAVPGAGELSAAVVQPHQAIRRWVVEACRDRGALAGLERNPFFAALGDRLATASDVLAAARLAEWRERDPSLTDLVVDTAPGVSVIDFLRSPRQVEAVVKGRMVRWLRAFARGGDGLLGGLWSGGRRVLGGFGHIGGARLVIDLANFFALVRAPLEQLLGRVEVARRWLASAETELLLVTAPLDRGAAGAAQLAAALRTEHLYARAVVVNRTWPAALGAELAAAEIPAGAESLVAYVRSQLAAQTQVLAASALLAPTVVALGSHPSLVQGRRNALLELGQILLRGLTHDIPEPRSTP